MYTDDLGILTMGLQKEVTACVCVCVCVSVHTEITIDPEHYTGQLCESQIQT